MSLLCLKPCSDSPCPRIQIQIQTLQCSPRSYMICIPNAHLYLFDFLFLYWALSFVSSSQNSFHDFPRLDLAKPLTNFMLLFEYQYSPPNYTLKMTTTSSHHPFCTTLYFHPNPLHLTHSNTPGIVTYFSIIAMLVLFLFLLEYKV